jgi:hypothetical protein
MMGCDDVPQKGVSRWPPCLSVSLHAADSVFNNDSCADIIPHVATPQNYTMGTDTSQSTCSSAAPGKQCWCIE